MMVAKTSAAVQSVAEILDGLKQNALSAVKHLLKEERLETMPVDRTVRLGWTDKEGQAHDGNITKVCLDGDRLCIQVQNGSLSRLLDENQLMPGCHIWLAGVKEAILQALASGRQTA